MHHDVHLTVRWFVSSVSVCFFLVLGMYEKWGGCRRRVCYVTKEHQLRKETGSQPICYPLHGPGTLALRVGSDRFWKEIMGWCHLSLRIRDLHVYPDTFAFTDTYHS